MRFVTAEDDDDDEDDDDEEDMARSRQRSVVIARIARAFIVSR